MLLDRYSLTPYLIRHVKLRSFTPDQVSSVTYSSQTPLPGHSPPLVKAHTKLPILAAYPHLTVIISVARCEIRIRG